MNQTMWILIKLRLRKRNVIDAGFEPAAVVPRHVGIWRHLTEFDGGIVALIETLKEKKIRTLLRKLQSPFITLFHSIQSGVSYLTWSADNKRCDLAVINNLKK